jgi:predicted transcriptional regulator YdeE
MIKEYTMKKTALLMVLTMTFLLWSIPILSINCGAHATCSKARSSEEAPSMMEIPDSVNRTERRRPSPEPGIMRIYSQEMPATRFIGKKYGCNDMIGHSYSAQWAMWFENGWFSALENLTPANQKDFFDDASAHIGLMRDVDGEPPQYWIGMFLPAGTAVPQGYAYLDFPARRLGVVWVHGDKSDGSIYQQINRSYDALREVGNKIAFESDGAVWFFERYARPRFTTPDEKGWVILDICFFIER